MPTDRPDTRIDPATADVPPADVAPAEMQPAGRWWRRVTERLTLMSGWTWVAAASLVGIEGLELLLGVGVAVPELIPLLVLGLAVCWFLRQRIRRVVQRAVVRHRARRAFREPGR